MRCNAQGAPATVTVVPEWTDFSGERTEQPLRSRIIVSEDDGGTTFTIPAAGVFSGALFLLVFGSIWSGVVLFIALLVLSGPGVVHPAALLLIPFFLIGLILLLIGCHLARRRVILSVRDGVLTVRREGLFGARDRQWPVEALAGVTAVQEWRQVTTTDASTGVTSTSQQLVTLLRILPVEEAAFKLEGTYGMVATAVPSEWEWLATRLRQVLELPAG